MAEHDPYTTAEAEQARDEDRRTVKAEADTAVADLLWLMSSKRGRRIMHRILSAAGLDYSSFNPNAMEMSRQEGRKELARGFRRLIDRVCPERYVTMTQENEDGRAAGGRSQRNN